MKNPIKLIALTLCISFFGFACSQEENPIADGANFQTLNKETAAENDAREVIDIEVAESNGPGNIASFLKIPDNIIRKYRPLEGNNFAGREGNGSGVEELAFMEGKWRGYDTESGKSTKLDWHIVGTIIAAKERIYEGKNLVGLTSFYLRPTCEGVVMIVENNLNADGTPPIELQLTGVRDNYAVFRLDLEGYYLELTAEVETAPKGNLVIILTNTNNFTFDGSAVSSSITLNYRGA